MNPSTILELLALPVEGAGWVHHKLGMLQLFVPSASSAARAERLHVWHPELVEIRAPNLSRIHDHVFDLEAHVLLGELADLSYHVEEAPSSAVEVWEQSGTKRHPDVTIDAVKHRIVQAGETYRVPRWTFHTTVVRGDGIAITLARWELGRREAPPTEGARHLGPPTGKKRVDAKPPPALVRHVLAEAAARLRASLEVRP